MRVKMKNKWTTGKVAALKEVDQLYKRSCFTPVNVKNLSNRERRKAQVAIMLLTQKTMSKEIKGRMVFNGKPTREWLSREDTSSPTASLEAIFLTATIDAKEERDVMTMDIPNAFIQTEIPQPKNGDDRVIMKITGELVDLLIKLSPCTYEGYVVYENQRKVIYVVVLRAIYGMLVASLLFYKKLRKDLENIGFIFNPYDPCVANRVISGSQHTIRFHVDDVMSSHENPKVNDEFGKWANKMYGEFGEVKITRGKVHEYLGMTFNFSRNKEVHIKMEDYIKRLLDDFPRQWRTSDVASTPAANNLFDQGIGKKLDNIDSEQFHTTVAKTLFVAKRARPDILPTVSVLTTRVRHPNTSDWNKLIRLLKYLNGTRGDYLTLRADDLRIIKWYVDVSFAVHPDFKSHTGGMMTMGKGAIQSISKKQKLNTRSTTEAELVGPDDCSQQILWTVLFMEEQGYNILKNILYQDNKSTILLEKNGRKSAGKRSRALNIRYFWMVDQIKKGNIDVKYCNTIEMIGDYMSKPLQGALFIKFRNKIMGKD